MKNLLSILFLLSVIITNAQYSKSGIIEVPGMKSTQIYNQSKESSLQVLNLLSQL